MDAKDWTATLKSAEQEMTAAMTVFQEAEEERKRNNELYRMNVEAHAAYLDERERAAARFREQAETNSRQHQESMAAADRTAVALERIGNLLFEIGVALRERR